MNRIALWPLTGPFAENKDVARDLRLEQLMPRLQDGTGELVLDFEGVEAATQSFIHALLSELLREFGPQVLDRLLFGNCNELVQKMIGLVVEYMQVAMAEKPH